MNQSIAPLHPDRPCICGQMRRTSRVLTRLYAEALVPTGLTVMQFAVLDTLARLANQDDGPITLAALAQETVHEKSALWRTIQPLIKQGWVETTRQGSTRSQGLKVTSAGQARLQAAMPHWRQIQGRMADALGEREAELISLLEEIESYV
jgi:Transcriptional regulators